VFSKDTSEESFIGKQNIHEMFEDGKNSIKWNFIDCGVGTRYAKAEPVAIL